MTQKPKKSRRKKNAPAGCAKAQAAHNSTAQRKTPDASPSTPTAGSAAAPEKSPTNPTPKLDTPESLLDRLLVALIAVTIHCGGQLAIYPNALAEAYSVRRQFNIRQEMDGTLLMTVSAEEQTPPRIM